MTETTIENIDITPDRSLMSKLGNSGYSLDESIAEFVDNSIDAKLPKEVLIVKVNVKEDKISVRDNAKGMNKEELTNSIRLGASKKENQLGKFGLGLKTSCLSLGKKFSIETSNGNGKTYSIVYNQEEWLENGDWKSFPLKIKSNSDLNGTTIEIEELRIKIDNDKIEKLKEHLGTRFGLFIKNNLLKLYVNEEACFSKIPLLIGDSKNNFKIRLIDGNEVYGWFGFQLSKHAKDNFGFHTYRNNRLITFYDKIGLSKNQKAKQIIGEIHLNFIPVTHNKRGWIKESQEYKIFEKEFTEFLRNHDKKLKKLVSGLSACPGRVVGNVKFLNTFQFGNSRQENFEKLNKGDILVTQMTRPDMVLYMQRASAIITDLGGILSHAGIVAREFNIPCIVGTGDATKVLKDGQNILVDATEGVVYDGE